MLSLGKPKRAIKYRDNDGDLCLADIQAIPNVRRSYSCADEE